MMERRDLSYLWLLLALAFSFCTDSSWAQVHPNCPDYVDEGQDLICTCVYRTGTPPPATPQFSWEGVSNTTDLVKRGVTRKDNGTVFTCVMVLGGQTSRVNYTLQVAYGPRDSDISITPQPPLSPDRPVTLTCVATEVNPAPTFTWRGGLTCAEGGRGDTCTFTPALPGDEQRRVTCTASNNQLGSGDQTASRTVTLTFTSPVTTTTTVTTATTATTATTTAEKTTQPRPTPSPNITTTESNVPPTSSPTPHPTTSPAATDDVSTTGDVSTTDDDVSSATEENGDQFPLAAFAGGMAGAFVLILVIIIVVVLCRRKKERDISLMRHGDHHNGSYKDSATKDFYTYDNNGYDQQDYGMTETDMAAPPPPKNHNHHHHHPPSSSSSRHTVDMERALGFYDSVPATATTTTPNNNNNNNNNVGDPLSSELADQDPQVPQEHQGSSSGGGVVRFENPAYHLEHRVENGPTTETAQPEDLGTTMPVERGADDEAAEGRQEPKLRGQGGTDPDPDLGTLATAGTETVENPTGQDNVYAVVNKPSLAAAAAPPPPPPPASTTTIQNHDHSDDFGEPITINRTATPPPLPPPPPSPPLSTTIQIHDPNDDEVGKPATMPDGSNPDQVKDPPGDMYARPQSSPESSPQCVEVSSDPSGTVITITNNHNVSSGHDDYGGEDGWKFDK